MKFVCWQWVKCIEGFICWPDCSKLLQRKQNILRDVNFLFNTLFFQMCFYHCCRLKHNYNTFQKLYFLYCKISESEWVPYWCQTWLVNCNLWNIGNKRDFQIMSASSAWVISSHGVLHFIFLFFTSPPINAYTFTASFI